MSAPPLTHHEIISLVGPFTRSGRHVDLAASDRVARQLVFKPLEHASAQPDAPGLIATLKLSCHDAGRFSLTRTLTHASGLSATLQASGSDLANLLAQVDAVPPDHHFHAGPGYLVVRSYDLALASWNARESLATQNGLLLSRGVIGVQGLTLAMKLLAVRGVAADITLTPSDATALELPEDLLAVQGWDWARLVPNKSGWTSKLRLRGSLLQRSCKAEAALDQVARHLSEVLAQAPSRYHDRHLARRWGVVLRRAIPTLTVVLLIVVALLLPRVTDGTHVGLWMALQYVPIAALALSFKLQELAQFEIPRWPRRPTQSHWYEPTRPGPSA